MASSQISPSSISSRTSCITVTAYQSRPDLDRLVCVANRLGVASVVIEIMAGPEADAQFHFTGIKKYFNSYTITGRMNCVLATYGGIALLVLYFKLRSKKTPAVKAT
ncbi:Up-regulated during skeletal muscle growth protein 5 [Pteropus alecto]|uniref:Up-regulated during skeletal muscle growth protein 5 n=2 Tax=Pteropus alecto TaxID=9402 RepID=L5K087_PTEAL|nr:Up-regulated during skeletal muscle growth protein 5 [Pteropus alecto]